MATKAVPAQRSLPDHNIPPRAQHLRVRRVCELTGLSVASVWRKAKNDKQFPKPRKIGAITVWIYGEVLDYLERAV